MLYPAPELPDDTPVENVRFSTRIRNAFNAAGMKTIGEVRETSDDMPLSSTPAVGIICCPLASRVEGKAGRLFQSANLSPV
jgi:hypothetical protein